MASKSVCGMNEMTTRKNMANKIGWNMKRAIRSDVMDHDDPVSFRVLKFLGSATYWTIHNGIVLPSQERARRPIEK